MKQRVRFLATGDNVTLAWARSGHGMPLVKASNWLTHLEYDRESPVWRHWIEFFERHFRYVRYDERGCGMSDREVGDVTFPRWLDDLENVVTAAELDRPAVLLGISQGAATAIAYAVRHPERISHLIIYGGYARGANKRGDEEGQRFHEAMRDLASLGWEKDNPIFRQVFTSRFIPQGNEEQIGWFNELCRRTTTAEIGSQLLAARADVDVRHLLSEVRVPTLVLHADRDEVVPMDEGRRIARGIPGAEFVQLESLNHVLLDHEPAWRRFTETVLEFTGATDMIDPGYGLYPDHMSPREREVLSLLCDGRTNASIAAELCISEKTVRNHISNLYRKLGVHSRTEAVVLAHRYDLPR